MLAYLQTRIRAQHAPLIGIIALGACFIFFRLTRGDFLSDDAHYSLRALTYIDSLSSSAQTTPLQWFSSLPWWAWLSFHDAPPLVFLIQHSVFRLLGPTAFAARLPFAVAGTVVVALFIYVARVWYGTRVAFFSGLMLVLNSYFIWASRIGLLEGFVVLWGMVSLACFIQSKKHPRMLLGCGLALGCAFISKYTAFYLLPVFTVLLLRTRAVWKHDRAYRIYLASACVIVAAVCAPVVIYNIEMYRTRGHFDLQFARLLGQNLKDWSNIDRGIGGGVLKNVRLQARGISSAVPVPLLALSCAGIVMAVWEHYKKKEDHVPLLLHYALLSIMFLFIGPTMRYLSLFTPFLAMSAGLCLERIDAAVTNLKNERVRRVGKAGCAMVFGMVGAYLFVVMVNTNHSYDVAGISRIWIMPNRTEQLGFNQLDAYLANMVGKVRPPAPAIVKGFGKLPGYIAKQERRIHDASLNQFNGIILYDENMNWFGRFWALEKWMFVTSVPVFSITNTLQQHIMMGSAYRAVGFETAYIVLPAEDNILAPSQMEYTDYGSIMRAYFEAQHIFPQTVLRDPSGQVRFHIYFLPHLWKSLDEIFTTPH